MGVTMLTPVVLCLILGNFLDSLFGTAPILMLLFIVLGVMAGFRSVYMISRDMYQGEDSFEKTNVKAYMEKDRKDGTETTKKEKEDTTDAKHFT